MQRRKVLAATGCVLTGVVVGCQSSGEPAAEIETIELENHRRDESHEFTVRIDRDGETVFEEARSLDPAGSGNSTALFEQPVAESGSYDVHVEAGEYAADPETDGLISTEETCLYLRFYLGASTLHWEHTSYSDCQ